MRKPYSEICDLNNHTSYECKKEPLWNYGSELCAAQVEDQSFFYIEEVKNPKATMEKSSTTVITVLEGKVTTKQIEEEFKHTYLNKVWRWLARKLDDNKFVMRFPDARMVQVYSNFKCLGMKAAEAQIKVEPWSSASSAKGELQHAWFRVKGIPVNQRSVRTIAKVGGLVGKTVEIDEKTRHKIDYVRVKIACRDVTPVPASAESSLEMMIYDFFFEREVVDETSKDRAKIGVQTDTTGEQPAFKKMRTEDGQNSKLSAGNKDGGLHIPAKGGNYKSYGSGHQSAPAKPTWEPSTSKNPDTQEGKGETSWGESEETDNYNHGINWGLVTLEDNSPSIHNDVRLMQCSEHHNVRMSRLMSAKQNLFSPKNGVVLEELEGEIRTDSKGENAIPLAAKCHDTETSMNTKNLSTMEKVGEHCNMKGGDYQPGKLTEELNLQNAEPKQAPRMERRTSTRLKNDLTMTTDDKTLRMGQKRNLEGTNLNHANFFSVLADNDIMQYQ